MELANQARRTFPEIEITFYTATKNFDKTLIPN